MSEPGVVAMEVSSHALDQGRVDGLHFSVGVFTNLSHDHLDYHDSMSAYFEAKARLFEASRTERAIISCDDEWGQRLMSLRTDALGVSRRDLGKVVIGDTEVSFVWRGHDVSAPVGGSFNVTNVQLACEAVRALGVAESTIADATRFLTPVPGRFEVVGTTPLVVVDFAHTPEGLDGVLSEVAQRIPGRVIVVFGCGGDRDRDKRPLMGGIASRRAAITIVTSDNSRSEDPNEIVRDITSGVEKDSDVRIEIDRREAIKLALELATSSDAVVIAGKGHEKTQETNGSVVDFDDVEVARDLIGRR
jgi:UDP-N-acetylmuramoyl-L-alanyl-D-glutamate--2,6-diaminopimelate ligase